MGWKIAGVASKILFYVSGALGLIQTFILSPFSQIAIWGFTWGQIITSVFILSAFYVYIELEIYNHRKPAVKLIRKFEEDNSYFVEIKNKGNAGVFFAQVEITGNSPEYLRKIYTGYWVIDSRHNRTELPHNHIDRLKIANFIDGGSAGKTIHLDYFDTDKNGLNTLSYTWDQFIAHDERLPYTISPIKTENPQFTLRVVISSIPDLKGGSYITECNINGDDLCNKNIAKKPKILNLLEMITDFPATPMMRIPPKHPPIE